MTNETDTPTATWRGVPAGAIHLATFDLRSRHGLAWREKVWLLRADGRDSLWSAVADSPGQSTSARALVVAAADSDGTPEEAGARLLAGYLAVSGAEPRPVAGCGRLPAAELAALVELRRAGWRRH
jgi:hypothetical protein